MSGAGGVNHAIGEAETDESEGRARAPVQRVHLGRDEVGELRLLGHQPADEAACRPAPVLAAGDGERPRERGRARQAPGRQSKAGA